LASGTEHALCPYRPPNAQFDRGGAEYTARGQSISSQKVGHTFTRMRQGRSLDFQLGSWRELATVYILVGTMYSKYNKIIVDRDNGDNGRIMERYCKTIDNGGRTEDWRNNGQWRDNGLEG